jgi:hypothetical protein
MITFPLYKDGLYLTESGIGEPDNARVGFILQSPPATPPQSIQLNADAWNNGDPNVLGYFAFFVPASTLPPQTRNWDTFGSTLGGLFQQQSNANQFGWFTEGAGVAPVLTVPPILVSRSGSSITVQSSFHLDFQNVSLQVSSTPFKPSVISFDDGQNAFLFSNPDGAVRLVAQPVGGGGSETYPSPSASLTLPLDGAQAGAVNAGFQLDNNGLAQFEAGLMYFGPPATSGGLLTALNYQVLRVPGTVLQQLSFNVWLDVLGPLDGTRTFFQFTDESFQPNAQTISSYFADTSGNTFALTTSNGDPDSTSRLVFANRPVNTVEDQNNYYLTLAGKFQLSIDGNTKPVLPGGHARMLCGTTGTEFLQAAVTGSTPDSIVFVPNQAAYALPSSSPQVSAEAGAAAPSFLSDCRDLGGNVTTSWVQFYTTTGNYISQPEQSPLFQQGTSSSSLAAGDVPSDFRVYVLDFLPLPTWAPPAQSVELGAPPPPLVPLVPYAGINAPTDTALQPFYDMEARALNPTRKNGFSAAAIAAAQAAPPPPRRGGGRRQPDPRHDSAGAPRRASAEHAPQAPALGHDRDREEPFGRPPVDEHADGDQAGAPAEPDLRRHQHHEGRQHRHALRLRGQRPDR